MPCYQGHVDAPPEYDEPPRCGSCGHPFPGPLGMLDWEDHLAASIRDGECVITTVHDNGVVTTRKKRGGA